MSDKINFLLDSQLLDAVQHCELKFDYDFQMHYTYAQPNRKMEMGSLLHDFFRDYYVGLKAGLMHEQARDLAAGKLEEYIPKFNLDATDCTLVRDTFVANTDFWAGDPITVISIEEPKAQILYEDDKIRIAYATKEDVVIDGVNFKSMPIDHKSEHSRSDPNELANQFIGYAWANNSNRILINKVGFQKTLKPHEKFRRYTLFYSEAQKKEWVEDTTLWVLETMLPIVLKNKKPKKNRTSCDKFGGCKYREVCRLSPENREHQIKEIFQVGEPWTPFRLEGE